MIKEQKDFRDEFSDYNRLFETENKILDDL